MDGKEGQRLTFGLLLQHSTRARHGACLARTHLSAIMHRFADRHLVGTALAYATTFARWFTRCATPPFTRHQHPHTTARAPSPTCLCAWHRTAPPLPVHLRCWDVGTTFPPHLCLCTMPVGTLSTSTFSSRLCQHILLPAHHSLPSILFCRATHLRTPATPHGIFFSYPAAPLSPDLAPLFHSGLRRLPPLPSDGGV